MLKPDNLFHIFGVIILLLLAIGTINFTTKSLVETGKTKAEEPVDLIFDPDVRLNLTLVCPLEKDLLTRYARSICWNRTLWFWYVPWLRHDVWRGVWASRIVVAPPQEANETEVELEVVEEELAPPAENSTSRKEKEKPSAMVYTVLVSLLVLSSALACLEVVKDRLRRREDESRPQERRCSLADFRVNRHLRRESKQNMANFQPGQERPAKVTTPLVHQGSLDRAISNMVEVKPTTLRRGSVPAAYLAAPSTPLLQTERDHQGRLLLRSKRSSCDLSGEETSPDMRRKSRHFIRRH